MRANMIIFIAAKTMEVSMKDPHRDQGFEQGSPALNRSSEPDLSLFWCGIRSMLFRRAALSGCGFA